ncbi:MAG: J domain-containing protein [Fimbriimonas ginsengisoli]|uniref:J domain-containing protein n=1 Tax=Fimbriimonas ginsengisoli TaxID=1005039 RepID=A0A931PVC7_FIMGI|nr:J domain-containing protein [Fimbriimonas ginsengisoli]
MSTGRRAYDLLRAFVDQEWSRLDGIDRLEAERELDEPSSSASSPTSSAPSRPVPVDPKTHARRILGLQDQAGFEEIRRSFERLNKRASPTNFPDGSPERGQAAQIQARVQWAYGVLSDGVDTVELRFRSLEIQ